MHTVLASARCLVTLRVTQEGVQASGLRAVVSVEVAVAGRVLNSAIVSSKAARVRTTLLAVGLLAIVAETLCLLALLNADVLVLASRRCGASSDLTSLGSAVGH